jgi:hypothetical protein
LSPVVLACEFVGEHASLPRARSSSVTLLRDTDWQR